MLLLLKSKGLIMTSPAGRLENINIRVKGDNPVDFAYYAELLEDMTAMNQQESSDIEEKCLNSLKKLKITRKFSTIDENILNVTINSIDNSNVFFTELLNLETKRLRFKEESSKCPNQTQVRSKISS